MAAQWTNYFIHSGHLHIDGRVMSRSLKNFITVSEVLETTTPRQLRLLFLNQKCVPMCACVCREGV
jgi:cysteinyl-tRNA synthetase